MCIIIAKPKGVPLPSDDILLECYRCNPDGFGMAYLQEDTGKVEIVKGALNIFDVRNIIYNIPNIKRKSAIFHFRIATEGKICAGNCHPFPLSDLDEELQAPTMSTDVAIAHNGVITRVYEVEDEEEKGKPKSYGREARLARKLSDTQLYIKYYLSGIAKGLTDKRTLRLIGSFASSKFAILNKEGTFTIGDFNVHEGCYYSNQSWKPLIARPAINPYDYDDDYLGNLYGAATPPRTFPSSTRTSNNIILGKCQLCEKWFKHIEMRYYEEMHLCQKCYDSVHIGKKEALEQENNSLLGV